MTEPRRDDYQERNSYGKRILRYVEKRPYLQICVIIILTIISTVLVLGFFPGMFNSTEHPEILFVMILAAFGVFWFIVLRKTWKRLIKKAR